MWCGLEEDKRGFDQSSALTLFASSLAQTSVNGQAYHHPALDFASTA